MDLRPGDRLYRGLVYRWVANTTMSFVYNGGKPGKIAFRPDTNEPGISVFLADLIEPVGVIHELDGYGVCEFTVEALLEEVQRLRESRDNDFDEEVTIVFEPTAQPVKGHAHCYISPMPGIVQKALYKRLAKMTDGYMPGPAVAGRSRSASADEQQSSS